MKKSAVSMALGACVVAALAGVAMGQTTTTGVSSSQSPYVQGVIAGVNTVSILTTGDTIGGYRMVGIPDGLGAINNGDGTFTVLMNHELGNTVGVARAHGQTGSFVSRWNVSTSNLQVNSGRDHNTSSNDAYEWNGSAWTNAAGPAQQWNRFCSGDLAQESAFRFGTLGTDARIYLNGEESGAEGRAYAHIASGASVNQTWQLPALGKFSHENSVASSYAQQKTIVMGMDDTSPNGQVYMYVGNKTNTGNDVERAGLTNGNLFGLRVSGLTTETRAAGANGRFDFFNHGSVTGTTGAALDAAASPNGVTGFLRPEDGAWDNRAGHQNDFYFVTTDRYNQAGQLGTSRLYRMTFDDITNPTAGGNITMLLDGSVSGPQMMDNFCIDGLGRILIQEDIGNNNALGKLWLYDTNSAGLVQIAQHDPTRFNPGSSNFITVDEESSGIIDAAGILGQGWFLMDVQAHNQIGGELVEGGQLLAMYVDPSIVPAPSGIALLGLGGLVATRRRR